MILAATNRPTLDAYIEEEKLRQSPLYVPLEDNVLDFSDIEAKYAKFQDSGLEKEYYLTKEKNGVILTLYPAGIITDGKFSTKRRPFSTSAAKAVTSRRWKPTSPRWTRPSRVLPTCARC